MLAPQHDLVLILVDPAEEKTASGLFIKEDWKSLPPTGTVVAIGPEVMTVVPGERVMFERYASIILKNDERLCKEAHIFAKVTDGS